MVQGDLTASVGRVLPPAVYRWWTKRESCKTVRAMLVSVFATEATGSAS